MCPCKATGSTGHGCPQLHGAGPGQLSGISIKVTFARFTHPRCKCSFVFLGAPGRVCRRAGGQDTCRTYTGGCALGKTLPSPLQGTSLLMFSHWYCRKPQTPPVNCRALFWLPVCQGCDHIQGASMPGGGHCTPARLK